MACIGSPNSCMDGDGVVRLSKIKSTKVNEICKKIEALIYTEPMFISRYVGPMDRQSIIVYSI